MEVVVQKLNIDREKIKIQYKMRRKELFYRDCGIGISGLAKYMRFSGHEVSGSDMKATHRQFDGSRITVFIGHDAANIPQGATW